jgi:hypothetical protein
VAKVPNVLVGAPSQPYKTVKELIAYAKAHPGKVTYASAGNGTSIHLAGALFEQMAQVDMVHGHPARAARRRLPICRPARPRAASTTCPRPCRASSRGAARDRGHRLGAFRACRSCPRSPKRPAEALRRHLVVRSVAPAALPPAERDRLNEINQILAQPEVRQQMPGTECRGRAGPRRSSSPASSRPRRPE